MSVTEYFRQELDSHRELAAASCPPGVALEITRRLCGLYETSVPEVKFHDRSRGKARAWYQPPARGEAEALSFLSGGVSCLLVVHEVAHCIHFRSYLERKAASSGPFPRERWHGPEHRLVVETCCQAVLAGGWHRLEGTSEISLPAPKPRPAPGGQSPWVQDTLKEFLGGRGQDSLSEDEVEEARRFLRSKYLASMPAALACIRCRRELPREDFGVRMMPRGIPRRVARQAQCRRCRLPKRRRAAEVP
jgi:hypothetical protein